MTVRVQGPSTTTEGVFAFGHNEVPIRALLRDMALKTFINRGNDAPAMSQGLGGSWCSFGQSLDTNDTAAYGSTSTARMLPASSGASSRRAWPIESTVSFDRKFTTNNRFTPKRPRLPNSICRRIVAEADQEQEIVAALRESRLDTVSDRLNSLRQLIAEDPDEPPIVLESLRSLALFLISNQNLLAPEIGSDPEGLVEAEWRIPSEGGRIKPCEPFWGQGNGIVAMKFSPSGLVRYVALSGPAGRGTERLRASGTLPRESIMDWLQPFASCLVSD